MAVRSESVATDRRSYAFLIERLLPTHRVALSRRESLAAALAADDRETLHREALAALQDLETAGLFEEQPAPPGARLFRHRTRGDQVLLTPPQVEQQASRPPREMDFETVTEPAASSQAGLHPEVIEAPDREASVTPSRAETPSVVVERPAPEAAEDRDAVLESDASLGEETQTETRTSAPESRGVGADSWTQIEPLLELATIEPQLAPYGDRLRHVVAQLGQALPGAQVRLLCLDETAAEGLGNRDVEVLDRAEANEVPHYREALRLGETQFATSAPVGADPASGRIAAAVPIYVTGEPWGLMRVTWEQGSVDSVPELARLMAPLSRLVAVAIQNQTMLEQLVFIDALTGVYNRAFYDRQVTLEIERANRTNQKFALLVMDIDDFKPINDQHGHRAGDQVLSQLAREVRGRMRKIDLMFRYGGEEFVLLLPGADLEEAQRTAERLRLVVSEQRFLPEGWTEPLHVSVSIGGAVYPDQSRTKTGIFNAADAALYRAKHEGKNRVRF